MDEADEQRLAARRKMGRTEPPSGTVVVDDIGGELSDAEQQMAERMGVARGLEVNDSLARMRKIPRATEGRSVRLREVAGSGRQVNLP